MRFSPILQLENLGCLNSHTEKNTIAGPKFLHCVVHTTIMYVFCSREAWSHMLLTLCLCNKRVFLCVGNLVQHNIGVVLGFGATWFHKLMLPFLRNNVSIFRAEGTWQGSRGFIQDLRSEGWGTGANHRERIWENDPDLQGAFRQVTEGGEGAG
jgi:hypothetical protein